MTNVRKMPVRQWRSVADLARWLLTHADSFEVAILVVQERRRKAGDPEGEIFTFCCPTSPIIEVLGMLDLAKQVYINDAFEQSASEPEGVA